MIYLLRYKNKTLMIFLAIRLSKRHILPMKKAAEDSQPILKSR
jgi:hypothetical protein